MLLMGIYVVSSFSLLETMTIKNPCINLFAYLGEYVCGLFHRLYYENDIIISKDIRILNVDQEQPGTIFPTIFLMS